MSGFCYKPITPVLGTMLADDKIALHAGENKENFLKFIKYVSYLHNALKFMPNFEQNVYKNGSYGDMIAEGIGSYPDPNLRGFGPYGRYKNRTDGDFAPRYGDVHHTGLSYGTPVSAGDEEGGLENISDVTYWGSGRGSSAQNLDFNPAAWEYLFSEDPDFQSIKEELEKPVDADELGKLLYLQNNDDNGANDIVLPQISQQELDDARSYIKRHFGDKSYYEIFMTGMDQAVIGQTDERFPKIDWNNISINGNHINWADLDNPFQYSNLGQEGARYLMINMLNDKYQIYYAMAKVFGSPDNITNKNSSAMIENFSNFLNNDAADVDPQNLRILSMYFELQHPLHGFLPLYSGGSLYEYTEGQDGGNTTGYVYTAKDNVGFKIARKWFADNISNDSALYNAFHFQAALALAPDYFGISLPYGTKSTPYAYGAGWDRFSPWFDLKTADVDSLVNLGLNPNIIASAPSHPEFTLSQILGLSDLQLQGYAPVEYTDANGVKHNYNLYNTNWAVNCEGTFKKWSNEITGKNLSTLALFFAQMGTYRAQMRHYRQKASDVKREKREAEYDRQRANAISSKRSSSTKKKAKPARSNKTKQANKAPNAVSAKDKEGPSSKAYKEAFNKLIVSQYQKRLSQIKKTSKTRK